MPGANASGATTGDHESVSGPMPVSTDHETLDSATEFASEKPEFVDDAAGDGWGMLESVPGFGPDVNTDDDLGSLVAGQLLAAAPWAWIVRVTTVYDNGTDAVYTGWLASPRVVVTSGRCVFDPSRGAAGEVLIEAASDLGSAGPRPIKSTTFRMVQGWVSGAKPECDYGAILLPGTGSTGVGHFGLARLPGTRPKGEWINVAGYPLEGSNAAQWYDGFQVADTDDRFLFRGNGFHTTPGSPLWLYMVRNGRAQRYVCGMVGSNADSGAALRMHRDVYGNLIDWIGKASNAGPKAVGVQTTGVVGSGSQPAVAQSG
jgi:V8-like Glu-specific endopeptidase